MKRCSALCSEQNSTKISLVYKVDTNLNVLPNSGFLQRNNMLCLLKYLVLEFLIMVVSLSGIGWCLHDCTSSSRYSGKQCTALCIMYRRCFWVMFMTCVSHAMNEAPAGFRKVFPELSPTLQKPLDSYSGVTGLPLTSSWNLFPFCWITGGARCGRSCWSWGATREGCKCTISNRK